MLTDIDKLVKYQDAAKELLELKKQIEGEISYDDVRITISPQVVIRERWFNTEGKNAKTYEFPLSQLDDVREKIRNKADYRKGKIAELKKNSK